MSQVTTLVSLSAAATCICDCINAVVDCQFLQTVFAEPTQLHDLPRTSKNCEQLNQPL